MTPPVKGSVRDGTDPSKDIKYTSDVATVASTWYAFDDPESGIEHYRVVIFRKPKGKWLTNTGRSKSICIAT